MYQSSSSHSAILGPSEYTTESAALEDQSLNRRHSWQLVAVWPQLQNPGDYVSLTRFGIPIIVRNHDGELIAVSNVCAHRNCELVDSAQGNSPELKCPYHGWRYGSDGRTRKIPAAKNFPNFPREEYRLQTFAVKLVGQLVFVHLEIEPSRVEPSSAPLEDWDGQFANRTSEEEWNFVFHDRLEYPCDWKVVIEGSLESYHLSEVHAETFGSDPGEQNTDHQLRSHGTRFATRSRESTFLSNMEIRLVKYLTGSFDPVYQHIHLFPGIMASFTDSVSLVYQIFPVSPGRSAMEVFGFTCRPRRKDFGRHVVSTIMGRSAKSISRKVLAEDAAIFPKVQRGIHAAALEENPRPRIFGRCEERLHSFHLYWSELKHKMLPLTSSTTNAQ